MKNTNRPNKFALNAIILSLLAAPVAMARTTDIKISQEPLLGVSKVTPSVVLAVSVEFPTALPAYVKQEFDLTEAKTSHVGYFDSNKCYQYVVTTAPGAGGFEDYLLWGMGGNWSGFLGDGYFEETVKAQTNGDYVGLCPGDLDWSGNMLNFMSMSALDIFRQTLTGGNRAKGVGALSSVYTAGDPSSNEAYLRRAMMWRGTEGKSVFPDGTGQEQVNAGYGQNRLFAQEVYKDGFINNLIPKGFVDRISGLVEDQIVKAGQANYGWLVARMRSGKYYTNKSGDSSGDTWWETTDSWHIQIADQVNANGRPAKIAKGPVDPNNSAFDGLRTMMRQPIVFKNAGTGFYVTLQGSPQIPTNTTTTTTAQVPWFNVVVKKTNKPIGLLQEKADMRTAVMGYLNEKSGDNSAGDGGVLRAKMAWVMDKEVNADGSFVLNPYPADASASGVANSGVINYVNKFGDRAQYDNKDPVSELYYTAIRYLRNGAWTDGATKPNSGSKLPYSVPTPQEYQKDGFPVITDWDDPMKAEGDKDEDMKCYAPAIIVLGDVNTHNDGNLPNFKGSSITDDNVALEKDGTTSYQKVCELQGRCAENKNHWYESSGANSNFGAGNSTFYAPTWGLAGMAYWVKTNDVRPDIDLGNENRNPVHISSFFIDVLESGILKTLKENGNINTQDPADSDEKILNSYYLAGKFASPKSYEAGKTYTRDYFDSNNDAYRSFWTDSPKGDASIANTYPVGIPRNYAIANQPEGMVTALQNAFRTIGAEGNKSQSSMRFNNTTTSRLDLSGKGGSGSLVGDGLGITRIDGTDGSTSYSINNIGVIQEKAKKGMIPLSFLGGYRASNWTGYLQANVIMQSQNADGDSSEPQFVQIWDAGEELLKSYHGASKYSSRGRHVETKANDSIVKFDTSSTTKLSTYIEGDVFDLDRKNYFNTLRANASSVATSENLIRYLLGDTTYEGNGLRVRSESLMGTSVYSNALPILHTILGQVVHGAPSTTSGVCTYNVERKEDYVAISSNEGMLHIFDMVGQEKYAYVPQTALPYIANFASQNYEHRYVTDGTSLLHEVCDGENAKTYLVGTSGRGGSSIYVIDVTDEDDFHAVAEINSKDDSDIGVLVSSPVVVNDQFGDPILIFPSGYNSNSESDQGYLFFYNLRTKDLNKVALGKDGVGSPVAYDENGDGVADRIYVGDHEGKLYRVSNTEDGWSHATSTVLFTGDAPITSRPMVGKVQGKTVILAGTGEYFSFDDLGSGKQNYAYGIFDDDGKASGIMVDDLLRQDVLLGISQQGVGDHDDRTYYAITHNAIEEKHKGWMLVLPEGYVVTSDSTFYGSKNEIAMYSLTKIDNASSGKNNCTTTGSTAIIAVDAFTGGSYKYSIFDVNNDGKFDGTDFVGEYSAGMVEYDGTTAVGVSVLYSNNGVYSTVTDSDSGSVKKDELNDFRNKKVTYRRVAWREIW